MIDGRSEERDSATIGTVESVAPSHIDVAILREAPHGTGLREGTLHRFPRINSYVVLPSERGSILAIVTWLGIENELALGGTEVDRIGLPVPRRRLRALPLGVLRRTGPIDDDGLPEVELTRGVLLFPTVGDPVRLPTRMEAAAAVPGLRDDRMTIPLGRAPLAGDAPVRVDPNRLFGRHLAVLGNTGSGKSCTVAQLIRASASAAGESPVAFRTIVLDLNGEYRKSFSDLDAKIPVRHFSVVPFDGATQLRIPAWLWNYREWLSFSDASAKSQAPQLRHALHLLRTADVAGMPRGVVALVAGRRIVRQYESGAVEAKNNKDCLSILDNTSKACVVLSAASVDPAMQSACTALSGLITQTLQPRRGTGQYPWSFDPPQLDINECAVLLAHFEAAVAAVGLPEFLSEGSAIDSPVPFDPNNLLELLPLLAVDSGPEAVGWVAPMVERLRIALADDRLTALSGWRPEESGIEAWLNEYLGGGDASQIAVLDLSLVPSGVLHLAMAVFARTVLEALERHRRCQADDQPPIILVVEEAHALIRRHVGGGDEEQAVSTARLCREAFERISREGRKFGLSLVLSSQRPSELSETVLAQCNTFLVHRLVNDHDQALVRRLVPDNLGGLTEELPALPSQTALALGWAIEVPTLVRVDDLSEEFQPRSADPDFAAAWVGAGRASADWASVAADWVPAATADPEPGVQG